MTEHAVNHGMKVVSFDLTLRTSEDHKEQATLIDPEAINALQRLGYIVSTCSEREPTDQRPPLPHSQGDARLRPTAAPRLRPRPRRRRPEARTRRRPSRPPFAPAEPPWLAQATNVLGRHAVLLSFRSPCADPPTRRPLFLVRALPAERQPVG